MKYMKSSMVMYSNPAPSFDHCVEFILIGLTCSRVIQNNNQFINIAVVVAE